MKNKKALSCLTALSILFFNSMGAKIAKSEEVSIESYEPLSIKTMFNIGENEEIITPAALQYSKLYFNGDNILIPSYFNVYSIVNDKDASIYKWNSEISFSKITEDFELPEDFDIPSGEIDIGFEYASKSPLFFIVLDSMETYISRKYYDDLRKHPEYSEFKKAEKLYDFDFEKMFLKDEIAKTIYWSSGKMSVNQYIETIYKKYVPKSYWPVSFNFSEININPTIPNLKEEILNKDKNDVHVLLLVDYEDDIILKKVILANTILGGPVWEFRDFFTGEVIIDGNNNKSKNLKIDSFESYAFISQMENIGTNADDYLASKNMNKDNLMEKLQHIIWDTNTVGDRIDAYQVLPLEYQMDYSYFDFSNSPNVVQPDKSSTILDINRNTGERRELSVARDAVYRVPRIDTNAWMHPGGCVLTLRWHSLFLRNIKEAFVYVCGRYGYFETTH